MSEETRTASVFDFIRMCESYSSCDQCSFDCGCHEAILRNPKGSSESILKWCDEHPQKTYAQDFFEKFPKAARYREENEKEYPNGVCRNRIFGLEIKSGWCLEQHTCSNCWNEIMPEEGK